ncbi:MAG TPA: hypothetical protein VMW17_18470 [Candidatus Binatia bacterium]|nr:hypothetical protein [Candidatus Binatia bacterium]
MNSFVRSFVAFALLAATGRVWATTVIEKDLAALAAEADQVFLGTVTSVHSDWADTGHREIETVVTFGDLTPLFGVDTPTLSLRFSGGQVGDIIEHIPGMPQFAAGQRYVIFAQRSAAASSIAGFHQGCFRVSGAGSNATVEVRTYEQIGVAADGRSVVGDAASATTAVALDAFLTDVRQRLGQREGAGQ